MIPVRQAVPADAARLAELAVQLGYNASAGDIRACLESLDAGEAVFVVEADGTVAGWLQVGRNRTIESAPHAEIRGLIVDAARRGRGLGARLVAEAAAWTRAHGLPALRVRSNVIRDDAHRFYRREGFTESKRQIVFKKELS